MQLSSEFTEYGGEDEVPTTRELSERGSGSIAVPQILKARRAERISCKLGRGINEKGTSFLTWNVVKGCIAFLEGKAQN